jgi:hypothetical protein
MGEADRIIAAIMELSWDAKAEARKREEEEVAREVIDLTLDDDDDESTPIPLSISPSAPLGKKEDPGERQLESIASSSTFADPRIKEDISTSTSCNVLDDSQNMDLELDLTVFADDESKMSLHDLLRCLTTDELKGLARQLKIKTTQNVSIEFTRIFCFCIIGIDGCTGYLSAPPLYHLSLPLQHKRQYHSLQTGSLKGIVAVPAKLSFHSFILVLARGRVLEHRQRG